MLAAVLERASDGIESQRRRDRLAREVAELTGESLTKAVRTALAERL